jgi:hypothetical protein
MKTLRLILGALVFVLIAGAAQAQQTVSATVPFAFVAGDRVYPAGEYYFSRASITNNIIQVSNSERVIAANILSNSCMKLKASDNTVLEFRRMGDNYFLYRIWVQGDSYGREFPRSQIETQLAQNHPNVETVIVAANLSR